jgi:hypothetical protein
MLTKADDFPLHQTPEPMAFAGTDRNFYDRFFFNGYAPDGSVFFAAALGVYPQLNIMDAAFCLSIDGRQYNLRASKEMNGDRLDLAVGPIRVEIVDPFAHTRLVIEDNEHGLSGVLEAQARHQPIEEPRFTRRQGTRLFMDYTRATQNIVWRGEIKLNGQAINIEGCQGTRDRSWGLRPVGAQDPQAAVPPMPPQFYWLWTPVNLPQACFFAHSNDDGAGEPWNRRAVFDDLQSGSRSEIDRFTINTQYSPDTRRIDTVSMELAVPGGTAQIAMRATGSVFYMQGLGYTHPEWGHGFHHGALRVDFDVTELAEAETALANGGMHYLHIQALAEISLSGALGAATGIGVMEQLFIGPHAPSGFVDLLDGIVARADGSA